MAKEIWKGIEEFPDYSVSSLGRVLGPRRELKSWIATGGYYYVALYRDKKKHSKSIHRLVAEAFLKNPNQLSDVDHINYDKSNNSINNLRWVTHKQNTRGKSHTSLSESDVKIIKQSGGATTVLAKLFNVRPSCVSGIKGGHRHA